VYQRIAHTGLSVLVGGPWCRGTVSPARRRWATRTLAA